MLLLILYHRVEGKEQVIADGATPLFRTATLMFESQKQALFYAMVKPCA